MLKKIGKIIGALFLLVAILITSLWAFAPKTQFDYHKQAYNLLQANEKIAAEKVLKEGILKHPDSGLLKAALYDFYISSNQWTVAEDYYQIAGAGFIGGEWIVASFAKHYFEIEDWPNAYKYYLKSGFNYQFSGNNKSECPLAALEEFRNAAAAASNMRDYLKITEAFKTMERLVSSPECVNIEGSTKYLVEVKGWLPNK